jgi:hypothetical protein
MHLQTTRLFTKNDLIESFLYKKIIFDIICIVQVLYLINKYIYKKISKNFNFIYVYIYALTVLDKQF